MASITTSVVLLRWPLVSAVLMFLASSLNIQLRKSDYAGLAVICSCLGLAAACWFATGLLGITLLDIAKIWGNIKDVMIEVMESDAARVANDDDLRLKASRREAFSFSAALISPNLAIISGRINLWITTIKSSDGDQQKSAR